MVILTLQPACFKYLLTHDVQTCDYGAMVSAGFKVVSTDNRYPTALALATQAVSLYDHTFSNGSAAFCVFSANGVTTNDAGKQYYHYFRNTPTHAHKHTGSYTYIFCIHTGPHFDVGGTTVALEMPLTTPTSNVGISSVFLVFSKAVSDLIRSPRCAKRSSTQVLSAIPTWQKLVTEITLYVGRPLVVGTDYKLHQLDATICNCFVIPDGCVHAFYRHPAFQGVCLRMMWYSVGI